MVSYPNHTDLGQASRSEPVLSHILSPLTATALFESMNEEELP